ncbi:hypothetical protein CDAR_622851 [Caerostris darwini]|uniref:Uncharacterized protein n=1 Tax=Caerostris darwini TaxID=1538125 RepID=A0AAV4WM43_9ARAC|nr:hypothetical protein CDAR_622851 [Caerostris darwini]
MKSRPLMGSSLPPFSPTSRPRSPVATSCSFYGVVDAHKRHPGTSLKQTKIFKAPCRFHSTMATTASPVWDWGCSRKKHFPLRCSNVERVCFVRSKSKNNW